MAGYWQRPEETANTLRGGWLRSGDIGTMDEDGFSYLVDRLKEVILSGGYKIYPRHVEDAIHRHPAVAEVTVCAMPDAYRGDVPKAFVRLKEGHELAESELRTFLTDKLSPMEMPRQIEFRAELPKTMIGKLSKKELIAEERARHAAESNDIQPRNGSLPHPGETKGL